mmetsp:Transcript_1002/g.3041  ORF Transcript_1002/g.3041 Transcript_1002/m.3041 type:complete len:116 (+) Transcript_1002:606-953(+)
MLQPNPRNSDAKRSRPAPSRLALQVTEQTFQNSREFLDPLAPISFFEYSIARRLHALGRSHNPKELLHPPVVGVGHSLQRLFLPALKHLLDKAWKLGRVGTRHAKQRGPVFKDVR